MADLAGRLLPVGRPILSICVVLKGIPSHTSDVGYRLENCLPPLDNWFVPNYCRALTLASSEVCSKKTIGFQKSSYFPGTVIGSIILHEHKLILRLWAAGRKEWTEKFIKHKFLWINHFDPLQIGCGVRICHFFSTLTVDSFRAVWRKWFLG